MKAYSHLSLLLVLEILALAFAIFSPFIWFQLTSIILFIIFTLALLDELLFLLATYLDREP